MVPSLPGVFSLPLFNATQAQHADFTVMNSFVASPLLPPSSHRASSRWTCTARRAAASSDLVTPITPPAERVTRALADDLPLLFTPDLDAGHYDM